MPQGERVKEFFEKFFFFLENPLDFYVTSVTIYMLQV